MMEITNFSIIFNSEEEKKAATILSEETEKRFSFRPVLNMPADFTVTFRTSEFANRDCYSIDINENGIIISAVGIRGFMYGMGLLLRKTEFRMGRIFLTEDISGEYSPYMLIRGHQLGWRTTANSYEAWTIDEYIQYIKELMFFGCNIFEHTVFDDIPENRNMLMKYSQKDFTREICQKAEELDIDVSFWYPNDEKELSNSIKDRVDFFSNLTNAQVYFPPGGDPGEFEADEFINRTKEISKAIKKIHPELKVYPSAQSPHGFGTWGDVFINEMKKLPDEIDGVITGPNCAMPLHELRKRLPMKYPIRLYPDITHNVRCEYPVHFDRDDWHYSLTSTLSREAINPRPTEYRTIHRMTRQYIIGSVSYSEGISDDINKMVWSDMDFFPDAELSDTLADYARLFFPGADTKKAVSGILGLEKNWEGDPAENPHIENTLSFFESMAEENPELLENARFLMCLFRAKCDMLVKSRRVTELELIKKAKKAMRNMKLSDAENILSMPFDDNYNKLRDEIFTIGRTLFEKVGLQLDVENYCANGWERGATLDTIDNPVTDRLYLLNRLEYAKGLGTEEKHRFITSLLDRNKTNSDEYYYSFAENGFTELGIPQEPFFYMDFQGDRPNVNNGSIPMSMLKVFDHYSFRMKTGGLTGKNYDLILNIKPRYRDEVTDFTIKINGNILYQGKQYGGERDEQMEKELSAPGFEMQVYHIPDEFIENGCIELEITEPKVGIMLSEIFIKQNNTK
ncbi:MAG: hypothetical protein IKM66_03360 [Clostridia bacterium]|nr:hypothetical protein [Clostridia bacterium]